MNSSQENPLYEDSVQGKSDRKKIINPLWLSVSEAAKLGGVQTKTIRRAIQANSIKFKIVKDRYQIELLSLVQYMQSSTKLKNKFEQYGLGQYLTRLNNEL